MTDSSRKIIELQAKYQQTVSLIELLESLKFLREKPGKDTESFNQMIDILTGLKRINEHDLKVLLHPAAKRGRESMCWQCEASFARGEGLPDGWITFPFYKDRRQTVILCPVHAHVLLNLVPYPQNKPALR